MSTFNYDDFKVVGEKVLHIKNSFSYFRNKIFDIDNNIMDVNSITQLNNLFETSKINCNNMNISYYSLTKNRKLCQKK